jgi:hypothetical protein
VLKETTKIHQRRLTESGAGKDERDYEDDRRSVWSKSPSLSRPVLRIAARAPDRRRAIHRQTGVEDNWWSVRWNGGVLELCPGFQEG